MNVADLKCPACGCKGIHQCLGKPFKSVYITTETIPQKGIYQYMYDMMLRTIEKENMNKLPPVGTKCYAKNGPIIHGVCEILLHCKKPGQVVICWEIDEETEILQTNHCSFEPIPEYREELANLLIRAGITTDVYLAADEILAAGFKKGFNK